MIVNDDESMRELAYELSRLREQVRILGGCCETTMRWLEKHKEASSVMKEWWAGATRGYVGVGLIRAERAGYERQRKESEDKDE